MVGMSFRDGSMRAMTADETGVVAMMADPWTDLDTTRLLVLASELGLEASRPFPTNGLPSEAAVETPTSRRVLRRSV